MSNLLSKISKTLFTERDFVFFALLLAAILGVTSVSHSWYTTADDAISATIPFSNLKQHVVDDVILTGRITHFVSDVLFWIPHVFNSFYWYKALAILPVILNLIFIPLLVLRHGFPKNLAYLCAVCSLLFFQNDKHHAQATSFVFAYTSSYVLGAVAVERYLKFLKTGERAGLYLSILLLLAVSYVYESNFLVFYGLLAGCGFLGIFGDAKRKRDFINSQLIFIAVIFFLYVLPYVGFRKVFPSQYGGATLAQEFSMTAVFKTLYAFSSGAYLFSNFNSAWQTSSSGNLIDKGQFTASITGLGVFYSLLVSVCFGVVLNRLISERQRFSSIQVSVSVFIFIWLFFSPNLPISITHQYQIWAEGGSRIHAGTYLSGFGLAFGLGSVFWFISCFVEKFRLYFVFLSSLLVGAISLITYAANYSVSVKQSIDTARWAAILELIDSPDAIRSTFFKVDRTWFAPDFWRNSFWGLQHPFPDGKDYWSNYFGANGIRVRVLGQGGRQEWEAFQRQCDEHCEPPALVRFFPDKFHDYVLILGKHLSIPKWNDEMSFEGLVESVYVAWNFANSHNDRRLILPLVCLGRGKTEERINNFVMLTRSQRLATLDLRPVQGCKFVLSDAHLE